MPTTTKAHEQRGVINRLLALFQRYNSSSLPINYIFWWPCFFGLLFLNLQFTDFLENANDSVKNKFLVVSAVHMGLLSWLLMLLEAAAANARSLWKTVTIQFSIAVVLIVIVLDFFLYRAVAIHVYKGLRIMLEAGPNQLLSNTGVPSTQIIRYCLWILGCIGAFVLLMQLSLRLSRLFPLRISCQRMLLDCLIIGLLCLTTTIFRPQIESNPRLWREFDRVMPINFSIGQGVVGISLHNLRVRSLEFPPSSGVTDVASRSASSKALPDIFMIVIESLRRDFLDPKTSPNLLGLAEDCMVKEGFSAGDATHISWFSLFTGYNPLYFTIVKNDSTKWPSPCLKLLRSLGYKIHIRSSSELNYHNLNQIMFGPNFEIVDSMKGAREWYPTPRPESDSLALDETLKLSSQSRGGRLFIVCLESTHHDYFWADGFPVPNKEYAKNWDFTRFKIPSTELELIKNRYRNSIAYVDSLVGRFLKELKENDLYDSSIVFLTGDHGEEFLEHGKLVHASEACWVQTYIPFMLKLPNSQSKTTARHYGTHVDFFPTVFDYLGVTNPPSLLGSSLLKNNPFFALIADQNGGRDPYQFCVLSANNKMWFEYQDQAQPLSFRQHLFLTKVTTLFDGPIPGGTSADLLTATLKEQENALSRIFEQRYRP